MLVDGGDADGQKGAVGTDLQLTAGYQNPSALPDTESASRGDHGVCAEHTSLGGNSVVSRCAGRGGNALENAALPRNGILMHTNVAQADDWYADNVPQGT